MFDVDPVLLDALYRGVTEPGRFGEAVQMLMHAFGCSAATLVAVDPLTPHTNLAMTTGVMEGNIKQYEQFAHIDPAPVIFSRLPVGAVSATNRIFTPEELRQIVFFQEFMRPMGLVETLGGNLFADKNHFALIGLQRGDDRREFDDDEIAGLGRVVPHLARALQLRRVFDHRAILVHGIEAAMDRLHAGIMLLDRRGSALFVNAAMRAITRRGDGFALDREGRPLPIDLAARRNLERLLAKGGAGGVFAVPRIEGRTAYAGLVAPVPPALNDLVWDPKGQGEILVIVHDPDTRSRDAVDILQQGLGLTRGAAQLLAALTADDDLQSFADREGITIHTARFHLRTALARTGATTQAELVRIAVRLLRDIAMRG
jgi:DNA-binding CsgD family transcriptional regulator